MGVIKEGDSDGKEDGEDLGVDRGKTIIRLCYMEKIYILNKMGENGA